MTYRRAPWEIVVDEAVAKIRARSQRTTSACSREQIAALESTRDVALPPAYARYLAAVGADPGDFLYGSDLRFDRLDRIQSGASHLLEDDGEPGLPPDAFVFCNHQGYQFLFVRLTGAVDPVVLYYLQGNRRFDEVAPSFSAWLRQAVVDEFPD